MFDDEAPKKLKTHEVDMTPPKPPKLVSLADVSKSTGKMLSRGAFSELDTGASPTLSELTEALHFALGDGRIWLNDQRMLLLHSSSFGALRREVIERLGLTFGPGMTALTGETGAGKTLVVEAIDLPREFLAYKNGFRRP